MRILHLAPRQEVGTGIADYASSFRTALRQEGIEVVRMPAPTDGLNSVPGIVAYCRAATRESRSGYDLVHAEMGGGALREFYAARRIANEGRVPVCATVHDPPRPVWWPLHSHSVRRNRVLAAGVRRASIPVAQHLESSVIGAVDALFVLTHAGESAMRAKYRLTDRQLLRILSYPTSTAETDLPPISARAHPGLTVGFFGYWYSGKGLEVLIDALTLLRDAQPPIHTKLWGDISSLAGRRQGNHYRELVLRRLREADLGSRVEVLGYLDSAEVRPRLRECDVVVLPYITSTAVAELRSTSASMFEALAAHTPVIASDVKALDEMIVDGVNGFLFEPGNAEALAACLRRLHADPALRLRLRDGARRSVLDLSLGRSATEAHEAYDEVLRRRALGRHAPRTPERQKAKEPVVEP